MTALVAAVPVTAAALLCVALDGSGASPPPREVWYESGGTRLFALENGVASGPVVIMLHGGMANHLASLPLVQPLAARFRVLTPDLRGSGRSRDAADLSFDRLADDVAALLDHLDVERAVVGGVSAGSGVALHFALRHPERVSGLVLVKPMYAGAARGYSDDQRGAFARMDALACRAPAEGVRVLEPLYSELPPGVREKALAMLDSFDPASVAATSRFLASGSQPFTTTEELRSIAVPSLLVRGDDIMHPPAVSALYAGALAAVTVVPAATADVSAAIAEFCERITNDPEPVLASATPCPPESLYRGGAPVPPAKLRHVEPAFPSRSVATEFGAGPWHLELRLGATGIVEAVSVLRRSAITPPWPEWEHALLAAIRQWRYSPTCVLGRRVPVYLAIRFDPISRAFGEPIRRPLTRDR